MIISLYKWFKILFVFSLEIESKFFKQISNWFNKGNFVIIEIHSGIKIFLFKINSEIISKCFEIWLLSLLLISEFNFKNYFNVFLLGKNLLKFSFDILR